MKQWYVVETTPAGQTVLGPLGMDQMRDLARTGRLVASTQVCEVGAEAWSRAAELAELRTLLDAGTPASAWPPAPVAASVESPGLGGSGSGGPGAARALPPFSFGNAFELAFDVFRRSWVMLLFCALLLFAGQMVVQLAALPLQILTGGVQFDIDGAGNLQPVDSIFGPSELPMVFAAFLLLLVASVLIGIPLSAAQSWIGVRAVRGQLDIADVVQPFRRYFAVLGAGLLVMLIALLLAMPGGVGIVMGVAMVSAAGAEAQRNLGVLLMIGGLLLVAVPSIYLQTRLIFALAVACDPEQGDCGPVESLKRSWAMTKGRFWVTLAYFICLVMLLFASLLLLCIGILVVGMPLYYAGLGAIYELARRDSPSTPA
jgi:hypothetical protein